MDITGLSRPQRSRVNHHCLHRFEKGCTSRYRGVAKDPAWGREGCVCVCMCARACFLLLCYLPRTAAHGVPADCCRHGGGGTLGCHPLRSRPLTALTQCRVQRLPLSANQLSPCREIILFSSGSISPSEALCLKWPPVSCLGPKAVPFGIIYMLLSKLSKCTTKLRYAS